MKDFLYLQVHVHNIGSQIYDMFGPQLITALKALLIFIIGRWIAKAVSKLIKNGLAKSQLDNKLFGGKAVGSASPEDFISKIVYYLLLVIVLMIVLETLGIHNVLDPLKEMVGKFIGYIPNIIGAGVVAFAGYLIANIVSELVGAGGGALERYSNKLGLKENMDIGGILKKVVFLIIFVPILIAALDILSIEAISGPAKDVLNSFMSAIPNIFLAAIIIGVFYFVGRFVTNFLYDLLKGLGVDDYSHKLGIAGIIGANTSISNIASKVAFFFIMFTGTVTAMNKLGFVSLSRLLNDLLELSGQIFFGLVILVIGNWISTLAYGALSKSKDGEFVASLARYAILGLFLAIALNTMGIAGNIVNLAFGLTLGAIAVAVALSFGLGGREAAGKTMEDILARFRK